MRPTEFEPPEALRDVVKCFWHLHRDLDRSVRPSK
jgi:hypothetical protein